MSILTSNFCLNGRIIHIQKTLISLVNYEGQLVSRKQILPTMSYGLYYKNITDS